MLEQELEILSALDHPNIIKFFEFYQDNVYFHIIMELCTGQELFSYVLSTKIHEEEKIMEIVFKIVSAIHYSHIEGVIHRDLKLENIMFENNNLYAQIKIIDWGLSAKYEQGKTLSTITGTYQYIAPEVFGGSYDPRCDIWSIGVITYVFFTRSYPFKGSDIKEYLVNLKNEKIRLDLKAFEKVSDKCLNFIMQCMEKNPNKRITIQQCYEHDWFRLIRKRLSKSQLDPLILNNLRNYEKPMNKLRSFITDNFINLLLKPEEIHMLRDQFQSMDLNGQGYITMEELTQAYRRNNILMNDIEIKDIVSQIDKSDNKMLNYSEFLIAAMDQKFLIEKENLIKVFNYFDEDNSGYIDKKNLKSLLQRTMHNKKNFIGDDDFLDIIGEVAKKDEGESDKIYLKDFLNFFGVEE